MCVQVCMYACGWMFGYAQVHVGVGAHLGACMCIRMHIWGCAWGRGSRLLNSCPLSPYPRYTRAYLNALIRTDTAALHHLTVHNIAYQVGLAPLNLPIGLERGVGEG